MAFGRRGKKSAQAAGGGAGDGAADSGLDAAADEDVPEDGDVPEGEEPSGPWDSTEVAVPEADGDDGRLDLGSVRVPVPEGGQIQVEMDNDGAVRSVHLVTPAGRITVAAFAAPRSPGLWREVAAELAQGLRADAADVGIEDGPWGREVVGVGAGGAMRFVGVDGPRWMVRCVAAGPPESAAVLATQARDVLRDTVVVRGDEPLPVRTTLPVTLPPLLAEQLQAARLQAEQEQAAQQQGQPGS